MSQPFREHVKQWLMRRYDNDPEVAPRWWLMIAHGLLDSEPDRAKNIIRDYLKELRHVNPN